MRKSFLVMLRRPRYVGYNTFFFSFGCKDITPNIFTLLKLRCFCSKAASVELMLRSTPIAERIFRNYEKAAKANDTNAMFNVGACYSTGYGVQKDENTALHWCVNAAKAGSLDAM